MTALKKKVAAVSRIAKSLKDRATAAESSAEAAKRDTDEGKAIIARLQLELDAARDNVKAKHTEVEDTRSTLAAVQLALDTALADKEGLAKVLASAKAANEQATSASLELATARGRLEVLEQELTSSQNQLASEQVSPVDLTPVHSVLNHHNLGCVCSKLSANVATASRQSTPAN